MKIYPRLTLLGAGPGDEELITLKGINALKTADVILYDALANPELLKYAPEKALKIFVGRRAGQHYLQQNEINYQIVKLANEYGHVIRLKGGDSFVFGRGHEEAEYARSHGVDVQVISGITSALAVPSAKGIPLTKRGINESFWVITGTLRQEKITKDLELAAQSSATVVILMGMKRLAHIIELFRMYRPENEPIGIIQNGTCPDEKTGFGTLGNIVQIVEENQLASPAIIVIGKVVNERADFVFSRLNEYLKT